MDRIKDIKDFTKYPSLSDNDLLLASKTDLGGTDAAINVGDFRKQIANEAKSEIKNGFWWVNGINTGVQAVGRTPVFRKTTDGLELKYEDEDDSAYQLLIPLSDLSFTFDDLSPEQVQKIKLKFSDLTEADKASLRGEAFTYNMFTAEQLADLRLTWDKLTPEQKKEIQGERGYSAFEVWTQRAGNEGKTEEEYFSWLRVPATDAAADARTEITNMRQLEATVSENEQTRENFYTQVQAKEQARQNDEIKRQEAAREHAEAEALRKQEEAKRNTTFNAKVQEATNAANAANEQAELAKAEVEKASKYDNRISLLETGKANGLLVDGGLLYLTSDDEVISDGVEVATGGGGGSGGGITMKVKSLTASLLSSIAGQKLQIGYNFTSVYTDDNTPTGTGTAMYYVNSQKVSTVTVDQGDNYFELSKFLTVGTNKIKVMVNDSTGASRSLSYIVDVISLSITDSYDDALVNTGVITYRYTPVGAIEKTIHFILDGTEIGTEVTTISNRQMSYAIPEQGHGAHKLEVYMTALVNDTEVRSNTLTHDLICAETGNNTVIVASPFNQATAKQYNMLAIPFIVYNPAASTSPVTLSVNNVVVSEQTVDRTLQTWNYRLNHAGNVTLKIASGAVSKTFTLTVSEAETIVEAETADLELYLTSQNRSNNDNKRAEWKSGDIEASLTDFNWQTNGWITEGGSTALRVSGNARVVIPFKIFATDFRASGKTIEFEFATRDVINYSAVVIDCLAGIGLQVTAQEALFKSEQTSVDTRFKEEERVRVAFVVEKKTANRLIYIFINGILSGVAQYPEEDNFQQAAPSDIVIGSNDCTVDIYNIRIYNNNLTQYQLLDNFIADVDDYDRKMAIYGRNQVYNAYGDISYDATLDLVPGLIIIGELPQYKGDKKTVTLIYTDKQHPERSFIADNVQLDVQGTSSQYYPRKNYKFKLKSGLTMSESGETKEAYPLRPDGIPAKVFCTKADFAESSGTHNTGMAVIADKLLKDLSILVPPQLTNNKVRTTIDGFPICIFHRPTTDGAIEFVGKFNFNYDKGAEETFGFADGDECWEFRNNTSDRMLFKSADFTGTDWTNDFEARYPDDDAINAEYESGTRKPTNLMALMEWVVSTGNDTSKFKAEVANHFDLNNLLSYYLFTELFAMVDQRAKNMFLTRYAADGKWRFILYDNDTCLGINNEGLISFGYNVEYHDKIGTLNVWNGEGSVLWKNVETCFPAEIEAMYKNIRSKGYLSYDYVMSVLNGEQSDKWCEAIYNADGKFKYIDPLVEDGNGSYLYAAQGSRAEHRKWWAYNRFLYMDSKYNAGDFLTDFATMRLYTPQDFAGVTPNADFTLIPYADQYVRVKYGSYVLGQRGNKDVPVHIAAPDIQFNDTETIVYGASRIKSLGDLSGKYAGTVDVSKCIRLTELLIGSGVEGYHNDNLTVLSVGENTMLRRLDIRNCPNLTQAVDLSGCENINEVWAEGTNITSVILPSAGILSTLHLPGSVTNLTVKNQPNLTDAGLSVAGIDSLTTIVLENVAFNVFSLLERCLSVDVPVLSRIRCIGISGSADTADILYRIAEIGGIDENGYNIDRAVLTGLFHVATIREDKLDTLETLFPELAITYDILTPAPYVVLNFSSNRGKFFSNAVFTSDRLFKKMSDTSYKVTGEIGDAYTYSFSADNHETKIGSGILTAAATEEVSVIYIPLRIIKVYKNGTTTVLAGARVRIGEQAHTTDNTGKVELRSGAAISGTAVGINYNESSFSFEAATDDTVNSVYLYPYATVTFTVKNTNGVTIEGVVVAVGDKTATTNAGGQCSIQLPVGAFTYTASKGIANGKGSFTMSTSNIAVAVTVEDDILKLQPEENGNIQMRVQGTICTLTVNSTDAAYSVNWGDGVATVATGTGSQSYSHTYPDDVQYEIEVSGCENVTYCIPDATSTICYWSIGNSKVNNLIFDSYSQLVYVGLVFKNDITRKSFDRCFYRCERVNNIPENLFSNCIETETLKECFYRCLKLDSIPSRLFGNCPNLKDLGCYGSSYTGCFASTGITSIPFDLFKNNPNIVSFYGCFANCKIKEVPSGLFDNCPNATIFNRVFDGCRNLRIVPNDLFDKINSITDFDAAFRYCILLEYIKIPVTVTSISNISYMDCLSLLYILSESVIPPTIQVGAFDSTNNSFIYVPDSAVDDYKTATNWSAYANRIKNISDFATDFPEE